MTLAINQGAYLDSIFYRKVSGYFLDTTDIVPSQRMLDLEKGIFQQWLGNLILNLSVDRLPWLPWLQCERLQHQWRVFESTIKETQ